MATFTRCYSPIKGLIARVIRTDDCGVPVTGSSGAMIVTAGFTQVTASPQYETGNRIITKLASGALCVNEKDPDILTNFELAIDMCLIDPGMVANTISPARLLTVSESPTGTGFAMAEGAASTHFSFETWQKVAGNTGCGAGGRQYVYNAWPHNADGKLGGDYVIGPDASTVTIGANTLPASTLWTAGSPWMGVGAVTVVADHWFQNVTTVAPPVASCGIQNYIAP